MKKAGVLPKTLYQARKMGFQEACVVNADFRDMKTFMGTMEIVDGCGEILLVPFISRLRFGKPYLRRARTRRTVRPAPLAAAKKGRRS
jgi:hypothetical protein